MKRKTIFAVNLFLLLATTVNALNEIVYVQPYLGELPDYLRERFSALALKQQAENNLASIVHQSNLIVVAIVIDFRDVTAKTRKLTNYESDIKIVETIKGKEPTKNLRLTFSPFTTGMEKNSKHLLFLKQTNNGYKVLASGYIYPKGIGFDNHIMLFHSIVGSEDIALAVVQYLSNKASPARIDRLLRRDFQIENSDKNRTAVYLAAAVSPNFGLPILKMAVSNKDRKSSDVDLYATAAFSLAVRQQPNYWQILLESVPSDHGRLEESVVFDLVSKFGNESTIDVIKTLVARRPELAVSAAFGLSGIGGENARSAIKSWLNNPEISGRKERIFNGWSDESADFSTLLKRALSKTSLVFRK